MAQILITNLTFAYEDSNNTIFEDFSCSMDTNWKLGLVGRNGKGKTTFLKILCGQYEFQGSIQASMMFDYFPYTISEDMERQSAAEWLEIIKQGCEIWSVLRELDRLEVKPEVLYQPFGLLSYGEQRKIMLAILFAGNNEFLLIDELTNHLDAEAREIVKTYLQSKKGYILVSHDRDLLDACIDHVLVLQRKTTELQAGNFTSWWENKERMDRYVVAENEKHRREIADIKRSVDQASRWAQKSESRKIGFDPVKENDRSIATRSYIGSKTKKMQKRIKNYEKRLGRELEEKEGLLQDLEQPVELKMCPLDYRKDILLTANDLSLRYAGRNERAISHFDFTIRKGERVFLHGANGCGKSTFLRAVIGENPGDLMVDTGELLRGSSLVISYVSQGTDMLRGSIWQYCEKKKIEESLLLAVLRQMDLEREQFSKPIETYSQGQKKKLLLATSLVEPAHLYIWDEPYNHIDIFSQMQVEELILAYQPTMIVVDHDVQFREKIATRIAIM